MGVNSLYYGRKGPSGFYIPSSNNPYTFLQSLLDYGALGSRIGRLASAALDGCNVNITTHNIESGLEFLKTVADAQRAHEKNFIDQKIKSLKALGQIGSEEQEIIDALEQINSNNFDYKTFIAALNMTINNIRKYKARIKGFNTRSAINTPQLNMVIGLKTMLGTITERRKELFLSQEELIRQLALDFFKRDAGQEFIKSCIISNGIENIAAALAIITQQLAQFLYDRNKLHYKSKKYYKNLEEFIEEFDRLANSLDDFAKDTNVESLYGNQELLDEVKELYGIHINQKTNKNVSLGVASALRYIKSELGTDDVFDQTTKDLMERITIDFKYNQHQLSYENELTSALARGINANASIGSRNMGTDMLLGTIITTIEDGNPPQNTDKISQTLQNIKDKLSNSTNYNNLDKVSDTYIQELTELDDALSDIERGFIFHETTKNYNTLERGRWPSGMHSFSGREMKLSNYIQALALMGNIGIDTSSLQFVAANLAPDAIGNSLIGPLEQLLAIFGGIIMFDDFAVIGREVTQQMQFSNVENIHLYRLQDTFFPASMFLDATYNAMKQLENELLKGNGFTATIEAKPVNYYVADGVPDYSYGQNFAQRWEGVRNFTDKNTKIHLHFAANFLSLMQALL